MPKVMRDPSRQQLPQRHGTELGRVAFESELCVRKASFGKRFETLSKQRSELVDELREQLALATDRAVPPAIPGSSIAQRAPLNARPTGPARDIPGAHAVRSQ